MPNEFSLLVVSDLHASSNDEHSDVTHVLVSTENDPRENAVTGLKAFLADEQIKADLVVCPGDLCHQADRDALRYAWRELDEIKKIVGAQEVVATAGNHDMNSRLHLVNDARGELLDLMPRFPIADEQLSDRYWARNVVVRRGDGWRMVVLNSCAYHGFADEHEHGRISESTLRHIEDLLAEDPEPINFVLCHHHPEPATEFQLDNLEHMRGGDQLVALLERPDRTRWMVIHGHRHWPALGYVGSKTSAPVRLAAGSVGMHLYKQAATRVRNQIYRLSFEPATTAVLGVPLAGTFEAWDWISGDGWNPATNRSGLPARGGFGWRRDGHEVAADLRMAVEAGEVARRLDWNGLLKWQRRLKYLSPLDLDDFVAALDPKSGIQPEAGVVTGAYGEILEVTFR